MTYIAPSDLRLATLAEFAYGLDLTTTEAPDAALTIAIASISQRIDNLTDDHFESESRTFELDVNDWSNRLYIPRRTRAVSTVKTRSADGTLTTESSSVYRLFSSLDSTGTFRLDNNGLDRLEIIGDPVLGTSSYLASGNGCWPMGTQVVQVTGTFSWATTPGDIKWAVARLCYARFKESRADLDRAETLSNAGMTLRFLESDAEHPTGIRDVDEIVTDYSRNAFLGIG